MTTQPRKRSFRLKDYDYSQSGSYFVTISTFHSRHIFGRITDGSITLSPIGIIVESDWREIPDHYDNISLDAYCIMPNHLHGIVVIEGNDNSPPTTRAERHFGQPIRGSLSSIIGAFKAGVTWKARQAKLWRKAPLWHPRFYDCIIRSDLSLYRIRRYINLNPIVWDYRRNWKKRGESEVEFEEKLRVEYGVDGQSAYEVLTSDKVVKHRRDMTESCPDR